MQNRLALVDESVGWHIELHALIQVQVQLGQLELLVVLVCRWVLAIRGSLTRTMVMMRGAKG